MNSLELLSLHSRIDSVVKRFSDLNTQGTTQNRADYAAQMFNRVIRELQHYINHPDDFDMAKMGYTLNVAINFDDEKRHEQMVEVMRILARRAFTQSSMLSDGRKPQVRLSFTDYISTEVEVGIKEGEP